MAVSNLNTAWISYTPTITQTNTPTKTTNYAKYLQIGRTVFVNVHVTFTSAGTAGGRIRCSLPIAVGNSSILQIGSGWFFDSGTAYYPGAAILWDVNTVELYTHASANAFGASPAVTIANTDELCFSLIYEI